MGGRHLVGKEGHFTYGLCRLDGDHIWHARIFNLDRMING
jgi:hypothetical protein